MANVLSEKELCNILGDMQPGPGVPHDLIVAIIMEESGGQVDIVSPTGAVGLMQVEQKYHPDVNLRDVDSNIRTGCAILRNFYQVINGAPPDWAKRGEVRLALACYNAGPGNIRDIPEARWPKGVSRYCDIIMTLWEKEICEHV